MLQSKLTIGILFIFAGLLYGSLIFDSVYNFTLGYLVQHNWINPAAQNKISKDLLGRKTQILFYSLTLIAIGVFLIYYAG